MGELRIADQALFNILSTSHCPAAHEDFCIGGTREGLNSAHQDAVGSGAISIISGLPIAFSSC